MLVNPAPVKRNCVYNLIGHRNLIIFKGIFGILQHHHYSIFAKFAFVSIIQNIMELSCLNFRNSE